MSPRQSTAVSAARTPFEERFFFICVRIMFSPLDLLVAEARFAPDSPYRTHTLPGGANPVVSCARGAFDTT